MYTLLWMSHGLFVGACGGWGQAAQGALGRPLPVLWRGRFCLCTFASFVMKPNKKPMFSSLPPLFSCPSPNPTDEAWMSQAYQVEPQRDPTHTQTWT